MDHEFRKRAEAFINANPVDILNLTTEEVQKLFRELDVRQVELAMQNEEMKKALDELETARDNYASLYNEAPVGYLTIDRCHTITSANSAAAKMLGVDHANLIKRRFSDFVHDEHQDEWNEHCHEVLSGNRDHAVDVHLQKSDGSIFMAQLICRPRPGDTSKSGRCLEILVDISARAKAEQDLAESRELLQTVVNHITASISLIRGSDLRVELINPAYQAIAPEKEILGKTLDEIWPETGQDFSLLCRHVLETGEPYEVQNEWNMIRRHPDGPLEEAWFSWSLHRIRLPGDEGWGLLNTGWDTTETMLAEKRLTADLEAMARLQEVGTLFVREGNLEPVLISIVDVAMAISGADFGNCQLLDPSTADLQIVANRGFPEWWLEYWNSVSKGRGVCGTALERCERVIVEDVEQSSIFKGTPALDIQLRAGVHAVQSTPLIGRSGRALGLLSTHFKTPGRPDRQTLKLLDLLARQAADIIERAQTEAALQDSENRYRGIFEQARDSIVLLDPQTLEIVECNEVTYRRLGYSYEEFANLLFSDFEIVESEAEVVRHCRKIIEDGAAVFESKHRTKNGNILDVEIRASSIKVKGRQLILAIWRDITERKQAEDAQRRLAQFPLENPNPVMRVDAQSELIFANAAAWEWLEAFGWSGEGRLPEAMCEVVQRALEGENEVEAEIDDERGKSLWVSAVRSGGEEYVNLYGRDVTERKYVQNKLLELNEHLEQRVKDRTAELQESEERFRTLFEKSPDACFLVDLEGRFIDGNAATEHQIGYSCEELVGQCIFESPIFPPAACEMARRRIEQLVRGEPLDSEEYTLVRKDGSEATVEVSSMLVRIGGKSAILCNSRDMTERKKGEVERELLNRKLRLALDAAQLGWWRFDPATGRVTFDERLLQIFGIEGGQPTPDDIKKFIHPDDRGLVSVAAGVALDPTNSEPYEVEHRIIRADGEIRWLKSLGLALFEGEGGARHAVDFTGTVEDITEQKLLRKAMEKRILALTQPLNHSEEIGFEDLFDLQEIQKLQDDFSGAMGVASIITRPDGSPITQASNFTDFCFNVIRKTEKGCANCYKSDAYLGQYHPDGPVVQPCLSGGLWDAGASIAVGGRHVANWLIGQVRDETQTDEKIRVYAREIGADEEVCLEAFHRVPFMSRERFEKVAQALFLLANQVSTSAYQNVQQARFIESQKKAARKLRENEERYRSLFEAETDAILIFDGDTLQFIDVNGAALELYGYARKDFMKLRHGAISADPEQADRMIPASAMGKHFRTFTSRHCKKDGTVFPVEISASSFPLKGRPVICAVVRDISDRVARERELTHNREELRRLASELSLAQQRERQRIATELHDELNQLLTSAYLRLDTISADDLQKDATLDTLDKVRGIINEAIKQTRSLTFELSCPLLYELGLTAALEDLCLTMGREASIPIAFSFTGDGTPLDIPLDRQILLYRATRELLINVIKHSEAKASGVELSKDDGWVRISVSDDGKGFDGHVAGHGFSPSGGFGLFNVGEYIRHVGGELSIHSAPNGGTQVALGIPLKEV